ncbi:MAG: hypothetical protein Q9224_006082, partial [Gallowayella concinna]
EGIWTEGFASEDTAFEDEFCTWDYECEVFPVAQGRQEKMSRGDISCIVLGRLRNIVTREADGSNGQVKEQYQQHSEKHYSGHYCWTRSDASSPQLIDVLQRQGRWDLCSIEGYREEACRYSLGVRILLKSLNVAPIKILRAFTTNKRAGESSSQTAIYYETPFGQSRVDVQMHHVSSSGSEKEVYAITGIVLL